MLRVEYDPVLVEKAGTALDAGYRKIALEHFKLITSYRLLGY